MLECHGISLPQRRISRSHLSCDDGPLAWREDRKKIPEGIVANRYQTCSVLFQERSHCCHQCSGTGYIWNKESEKSGRYCGTSKTTTSSARKQYVIKYILLTVFAGNTVSKDAGLHVSNVWQVRQHKTTTDRQDYQKNNPYRRIVKHLAEAGCS